MLSRSLSAVKSGTPITLFLELSEEQPTQPRLPSALLEADRAAVMNERNTALFP